MSGNGGKIGPAGRKARKNETAGRRVRRRKSASEGRGWSFARVSGCGRSGCLHEGLAVALQDGEVLGLGALAEEPVPPVPAQQAVDLGVGQARQEGRLVGRSG